MLKTCCCLLMLVAFDRPAFAKLGESVAEAENRLGKPAEIIKSPGDERRIYRKDEYQIDILFVKGTSLRETLVGREKNSKLGVDECIAWAKVETGRQDWKLSKHSIADPIGTSGTLFAHKTHRAEDNRDYFSIYGEGFAEYFRKNEAAMWAVPSKTEGQH